MTFINNWLSPPDVGRPRRRRSSLAIAAVATLLSAAIDPQSVRAEEDPRDRSYVMEQVNQALETRKTDVETPWRNPITGSHGIIVVERTFYRDTGEPCRDYRRTSDRPGAPSQVFRGTGCRVGPARWEIDEKVAPPAQASETDTGRAPAPGTKAAAPPPAPAAAKKPAPPTTAEVPRAPAETPASCPDPPPVAVVKAPCAKPEAFTPFTLPSKARL